MQHLRILAVSEADYLVLAQCTNAPLDICKWKDAGKGETGLDGSASARAFWQQRSVLAESCCCCCWP